MAQVTTKETDAEPKVKLAAEKKVKNVTWAQVVEARQNYYKLVQECITGKEKNTAKLRRTRKDIARMITKLNSKTVA